MSHIGNWELAAQALNSKGMPIMLYLGAKLKEQMERVQKENLAKSGIRIVATSEDENSPFALIEGINFLREGEIVSMAGDRLWGRQSYVTVDFMGYEARLPDTPHLFALMTGAPILTFFVYQEAVGKYHIKVSRGRKISAASRAIEKKRYRNQRRLTPMILPILSPGIPLNGIILSHSLEKQFIKRYSTGGIVFLHKITL